MKYNQIYNGKGKFPLTGDLAFQYRDVLKFLIDIMKNACDHRS